ncbi:hypothetical protein [Sedimenticola selenatireducens]|uniref:hypothetical protein n=1 Tax=Sedimenticola selenatireducens TaxID=191960 RepID=UPI00048C056B|nr:hypothetical protein [Sedimenticola selenatireducens]
MKRVNKLLMVVTLVSLVISFMSFGISVIGGLIDSTVLILFWYLGLAGLWAILMASVIAIGVFLFVSTGKYFQSNPHRLKGHGRHSTHAMI